MRTQAEWNKWGSIGPEDRYVSHNGLLNRTDNRETSGATGEGFDSPVCGASNIERDGSHSKHWRPNATASGTRRANWCSPADVPI